MNRFAIVLMFMLATGCPPPQPITGSRCATDDDIRANCGLCASARTCGWCATDDPDQRGCYDRSRPFTCEGVVVSTLEGCELVTPAQAGL
jgi:hypothetical protein